MSASDTYEARVRACTLCADILAKAPVDGTPEEGMVVPRPIVMPLRERAVMLIGQAPGLSEYRQRRPFSGPAGKEVRKLFAECGCGAEAFERIVHSTAVVKCFPGSKLTRRRGGGGLQRGDVKPSAAMRSNCRSFLQAQLDVVSPRLIVLLGATALETYVEMRDGKKSRVALRDFVGRVDEWGQRRVVALAHTSGGSFWLNEAANRALQAEAKHCLTRELAAHL